MSIGLIGKKVGMTRIFTEEGEAIAVTVIEVSDNAFLQKKTTEKDGYTAVQVAFDEQKEARLNQPTAGHYKSNGVSPKRVVREFRLESDDQLPEVEHPGMEVFEVGQWIDVIGTTKGKGFQGVMRRYGFQGQNMTHGSMMHRRPGAIGAGSTPARVWKNQKMPGRQGNAHRTVQNLKVVQLRPDDNVILVSGAVPGAKGGYVMIRPAVKHDAPVQDFKAKEKPAADSAEDAAASEE